MTSEYLEMRGKTIEEYMEKAEALIADRGEELEECTNLMRLQIRCSQFLMDEGQISFYQEDGFILGGIIFGMRNK